MKRVLVLILAVALVAGLTVSGSTQRPPKVGIVFDIGGLGDQSFNDSAYVGLKRLEKELGAQITYMESKTPPTTSLTWHRWPAKATMLYGASAS